MENTVENGTPTPTTEEKTFTQEEMNRVVQERLARERAKQEEAQASLAAREQELAKREFAVYATEVLKKNDLPVDILGALNQESQEAFENAVSIICQHMKKPIKRGSANSGMNPGPTAASNLWDNEDKTIRSAMGLKK